MKKTVSILMILLLLAVTCIGFVACDDGSEENMTLERAIKNSAFHQFLIKTEFSFGGFEWVDLGEYFEDEDYKHTPRLIFKDNTAIEMTADKIQEIFEQKKDLLLSEYSADELDRSFNGRQIKATTILAGIPLNSRLRQKDFTKYEVGDFVHDVSKETEQTSRRQLNDMVHDVYSFGDYTFVFASASAHMVAPWERFSAIYFYTIAKNESGKIFYFRTSVRLTRGDIMEKFYPLLTKEERQEIAQYFQAVHKEICTEWYKANGNKI